METCDTWVNPQVQRMYLLGVIVGDLLQGSIISPVSLWQTQNMWRLGELMGWGCVCHRGLGIGQLVTLGWPYMQKLCLPQGAGDIMETCAQSPVTITTSAYMFTQVSHASITSPDPCDKHNFRIYIHPSVTCFHYIPASCNKYNFRLYVHPSVTCFHYIPNSLWQAQTPTGDWGCNGNMWHVGEHICRGCDCHRELGM
jgi:hypothetical protein